MNGLFNQKGALTVEIGKTWLSRGEIADLASGDMVRLNSFAGISHKLMFNGYFLATCDMVILGDIWGVRINDFRYPPEQNSSSRKENLTELLPVEVRLGRADYTLEELGGLKPGAIISMDSPFTPKAEAELFVSGLPAAKGIINCLYENYGLRITEILFPSAKGAAEVTWSTGQILKAGFPTDFCRDYDFRRPDKFSKLAIQRVHDIHKAFLHSLAGKYEAYRDWSVTYVDQAAFYETFPGLESHEFAYLTLRDKIRTIKTTPLGAGTVEPASPRLPLSKEIKEFIKGVQAGVPKWDHNAFVCFPDNIQNRDIPKMTASLLTASWRNVADLNFTENGQSDSLESIKTLNENEMVLIIRLGPAESDTSCGKIDGKGIYFIYPYITLNPVVNLLNL